MSPRWRTRGIRRPPERLREDVTTPAPPGAGVVWEEGGANDQALARPNVRAAIQIANAARTVVITTPIAISGLPQSLLNSARAASVAWVSGLRLLRNFSQSGASAIGSRMPDSRS